MELDTHCFLCNQKFFLTKCVSKSESMRNQDSPELTLFQFIQSISNFNQLNIADVSENVCVICYQAAQLSMKFQTVCNKSAGKLRIYLGEPQKMPNITLDKDLTHVAGQSFPAVNPECTEILDDIPNKKSNEDHEPIVNEKAEEDHSEDSLSDLEEENFRRMDKPSKEELLIKSLARMNEKIKCKICDEIYIHRDKVEHYKTHLVPYECKICHKTYNTKQSFMKHKRTHETAKYLCSFCGMGLRSSESLKNHIVRHTNLKRCFCEICGRTFGSISSLRNYISIHTGEKPFLCPVCAKTFRLEHLLKQHLVIHAKIKPIQCNFCGARFTQKHALRSHVAKSCKGYKEVEKENGENEHGKEDENEDGADEKSDMDDDSMGS